MKRLFMTPGIALLVTAVFALQLFAPHSASAAWVDQSGDLPKDDFPTGVVIVAAVAVGLVVGYVVYRQTHKADPKEEQEETQEESSPETGGSDDSLMSGQAGLLWHGADHVTSDAATRPAVGLYFNVTPDTKHRGALESSRGFSSLSVRAGLSFGY